MKRNIVLVPIAFLFLALLVGASRPARMLPFVCPIISSPGVGFTTPSFVGAGAAFKSNFTLKTLDDNVSSETGCSGTSTDVGGLEIWHEIDTNAAGQQVIRFPFLIPGM